DNPYCEITYDGYVAPSIFEIPGAWDCAVEFHSLSKTFCMTGWRLGWAAGRAELIAALARVKNYVDTGAFLAVQAAGAAVLPQAEQLAREYVARFRERRDAMLPVLRAQGFEPETPRATLYLWVPLPEGLSSATFQRRALEEEGVVTVPGSGFGAGGGHRHDHSAARTDGGQAGQRARRQLRRHRPASRQPAASGRRAAVGAAASRAPGRSGRRPVRGGRAQGLGGGAPAARHGRLAERDHRPGAARAPEADVDHRSGGEDDRHRFAVHPRRRNQDPHGGARAAADHAAARQL